MKLRRLPLLLGELDRAPPDFDLNYLSIDRYTDSTNILHTSKSVFFAFLTGLTEHIGRVGVLSDSPILQSVKCYTAQLKLSCVFLSGRLQALPTN